ncbi:MAG: CatB-related O-acetyltransferase [Cyanobacteria bacterium P01_A01_bin.3]
MVIENDVWIGERCTILSGVTIGSGSVVAAKSVVTKSVPPYAIVGGNPAKLIRFRFTDEIINQLLALKWWDLDDSVIDSIVPLLQSPMSSATIARITDMVAQATDTAPS